MVLLMSSGKGSLGGFVPLRRALGARAAGRTAEVIAFPSMIAIDRRLNEVEVFAESGG